MTKGTTLSDEIVEATTKAILFEDCGSTEDWQDNINLGQAAVEAVLNSPEVQALKEALQWAVDNPDDNAYWIHQAKTALAAFNPSCVDKERQT